MITRSELAGNPAKAFDKAYGALSGLAIGDSLGDAARKPENRANYGITTDFNKGASWSTDDTEFALLTAKTLIGCGGNLTSEIVVDAWLEDVAVQDEFKRGGASEIEAANNLRKGIRPPLSGKYNAFHMSDGSAMRIGPVGIICAGCAPHLRGGPGTGLRHGGNRRFGQPLPRRNLGRTGCGSSGFSCHGRRNHGRNFQRSDESHSRGILVLPRHEPRFRDC